MASRLTSFGTHNAKGRRRWIAWAALLLAILVLICIAAMERRFVGLETEEVLIGATPVTLYRAPSADPAPPVVVAHGFGGSRQMMDQIAVSLARQGFLVASVDLPGHGRHSGGLSPDISSLAGTTAQLVDVVEQVADAIAARPDTRGPISYVGHSMATDIVIRASKARSDVGGVVAISMYSPAITATEPAALLVLSGATEGHLRAAGLDAVRLVDAMAEEGQTVTQTGVSRRTAVAPWVGHVGVLYATTSLQETTDWLRTVVGVDRAAPLDRSGWIVPLLLGGLMLLVWPVAMLMPRRTTSAPVPLSWRMFLMCLAVPVPAVLLVAALPTFGIGGYAAFGTLGAAFGAWGLVQLALLWRAGRRPEMPDVAGVVAYLVVALVFALALDRYGASFVPTGPRWTVMLGLLIGTVPLMIADTVLVQGASLLRRLLARAVFLATLSGAMALAPSELGLAFTTLPVLVLFFLVYGTMAQWIGARLGQGGVAFGKGVALAWSIAATTPLFAVGGLS